MSAPEAKSQGEDESTMRPDKTTAVEEQAMNEIDLEKCKLIEELTAKIAELEVQLQALRDDRESYLVQLKQIDVLEAQLRQEREARDRADIKFGDMERRCIASEAQAAQLQTTIEKDANMRMQALGETLTHGMNCAGFDLMRDCTCGLSWRVQLQTEQNMHAAWRKRAEEAEQQYDKALTSWAELKDHRDQLQTTISQLDQLVTNLWDFATFTPSIGCALEEMRVLRESLARFKATTTPKPEEGK